MGTLTWVLLAGAAFLGAVAVPTPLYETLSSNISVDGKGEPDYWVHVYAPKSSGTFPTIFFVSGFGATAPVFAYSDLLTRTANKGYVVVGIDRFSIPNYPKEAKKFMALMAWAKKGGLASEMVQKKISATPDLNNTIVMAQSSGNHIVGQALAYACMDVKAFVLIDPVDGVDPFGIVHSEDLIIPGKKLNFSTPAIILDNGLDPQGTRLFKSVPCMPIKLGSPRWYNAWRGPIWHVNATAYGHIDCLDDSMISVGGLLCPTNSKTDKVAYREHLAATSTLFIEAILHQKPDNFLLLENPGHFQVDVVLEHDRKGLKDIEPGCTNVPVVETQLAFV